MSKNQRAYVSGKLQQIPEPLTCRHVLSGTETAGWGCWRQLCPNQS